MNISMQNKRVFVTGGAGVIGTELVERLLEQGAHVFVGDLKSRPLAWSGKVKYRCGDLNNLSVEELLAFDPQIVFHLAATFERSEESRPFFEENFRHNIALSHHLLRCISEMPSLKKVLFASSYLIYNPDLYQFSSPQNHAVALAEDSPIYPRNICGVAKLLHELEMRFFDHFLGEKVSFTSARIFRVYGKGSRDIISRWIRAALNGEQLLAFGCCSMFDYIYAGDVAEGLLKLAGLNEGGIFNLGSGRARQVSAILDALRVHFSALVVKEVDSPTALEYSEAAIGKLQDVIGWSPPTPLEVGVEKLIAYERAQLQVSTTRSLDSGVLITSISKKMPLINAIRSATDRLGHFKTIHGCDSDPTCLGRYGVDRFWQSSKQPHLSPQEVIAYCKREGIGAIIPTRDGDLTFYSEHRSLFEDAGIQLMISSESAVHLCIDKLLFAKYLQERGLPFIPTSEVCEASCGERVVVKERFGAGAKKIGCNLAHDEALCHGAKLEHPIFQPYISGVEWSVDLYRTRQGVVKGIVARRRDLVVDGESQVTTTARHPRLEELCHQLADVLELYGHAIIQCIEDPAGNLHPIECNPRFGGASTASLAVGLDSFSWFFLECLGEELSGYLFHRSPIEIRQVRCAADFVFRGFASSPFL